jgi:hypothetical protein
LIKFFLITYKTRLNYEILAEIINNPSPSININSLIDEIL